MPLGEKSVPSYKLWPPGTEPPPSPPTGSFQVNLSTGKVGGVGSSVLSEVGTLQVWAITGRGGFPVWVSDPAAVIDVGVAAVGGDEIGRFLPVAGVRIVAYSSSTRLAGFCSYLCRECTLPPCFFAPPPSPAQASN